MLPSRQSPRIVIPILGTLAITIIVAIFWVRYPYQPLVHQSAAAVPLFDQATHAARGTGVSSARVDSQITLAIPNGEADAVYQYLQKKYVGKEGILKKQFPALNLYGQPLSDTSIFTDDYYDTPSLDLFRNQNSARHRKRVNTTNPSDSKSGRELIQIKVTPPGQFDTRTELKYDVKSLKKTHGGHGGKNDNHPLIRVIAEKYRGEFKNVFRNAGVDPYTLKKIFTLTQTRRRVYLNWGATNILSFSVDDGGAGVLWATARFSSIDIGLVEVAYTEADEAKRKTLWEIRDAVITDLREHFPDLTTNTDSKYGIVLDGLIQKIHPLPLLVKHGIL